MVITFSPDSEAGDEEMGKRSSMSFVILQPHAPLLKRAVFATALSLIASQGLAQRAANSPFFGLSGNWSGGGAIAMTNGATERIRCKATYAVNSTGRALNQSLRCASDSYRLEISSNIIFEGGAISGTWSEATRNVSGTVSGRATSAEIQARVAGGGFSASLAVRTHGDRQTVAITPHGGTDVASVSVTLRKG
jgi:hypothetical protein